MPNWTVRAYKPEDKEQTFALMEAVAGHAPDRELYEWYIERNPYLPNLGWVADDNGKIVGRYGMVPMELQVQGKRQLIAQAVEIMTHPDYRRQGMFPAMASQVFADLPALGITFAIGFPNDAARPGHQKFGWKELGWITAAVRPLHAQAVSRRLFKNPAAATLAGIGSDLALKLLFDWRRPHGLESVRTQIIERFDPTYDDLWQRVSARYPISLVRDSRYLNWRYIDCPYSYIARSFLIDDKLVGGSVVRMVKRPEGVEGHICDLILDAERPWLFDVAIHHALKDCRAASADFLGFRIQSPDNYLERFTHFGARQYQGKMILIAYDKLLPQGAWPVDHTDLHNWLVTFGDSDAI